MKTGIKNFLPILISLIIIGFIGYSCKKEDPYYRMTVKVRYKADESPVSGATVHVFKKQIDTTLSTDSRGEISLEYKHPMILDVSAQYETTLNGDPYVMLGKAVVKLEENTTVEKVVYIQ